MNIDAKRNEPLNCMKCEHFFVTWDPSFPRGCRLFGFKSSAHPSVAVHEATGGECRNYVGKIEISARRPGGDSGSGPG